MQRLTERDEKGFAHLITRCADGCKYGSIDTCNHECDKDFIEKLAEYEDLEEQGLLLRLEKTFEESISKEGDSKDVT